MSGRLLSLETPSFTSTMVALILAALASLLLALLAATPALAVSPAFLADQDGWPTWARGEVEQALRWDLFQGVPRPERSQEPAAGPSTMDFRPNDRVTRAQFATTLVRATGLAQASPSSNALFKDVQAGAWYHGFINALSAADIVRAADYPGGNLGPDEPITRAEMATWLGRALLRERVTPAAGTLVFTDLRQGDRHYADIMLAARAGVIKGSQKGSGLAFEPASLATRAQAAAMMVRFLKLLTDAAPAPDELTALARATGRAASRMMKARAAASQPEVSRFVQAYLTEGAVRDMWRSYLAQPLLLPGVWYTVSYNQQSRAVFLGRGAATILLAEQVTAYSAAGKVAGSPSRAFTVSFRKEAGAWRISSIDQAAVPAWFKPADPMYDDDPQVERPQAPADRFLRLE